MMEAVPIVRNVTTHLPDYTVSQPRSADCASYATLPQKVSGCLEPKQCLNVLEEFMKQNNQLKPPAGR
jgi:hypothetical protein